MNKRKHNHWENLRRFRYAHRGLFHQPRSASRKLPEGGKEPLWREDIARWKAEGRRIVPENSMKAFRMAVRYGFGSELDVRLTLDGRLAVFHDTNLLRMTGTGGRIEKMTWRGLSQIRLLDTSSGIPLLEEVLDLYAGNHLPLIIELKAEGNVRALCRTVMETIDRYPALNYCIESFDPRAVLWFRINRPDVIRGQLTENFTKSREAVRQWGYLMTLGMWSVAPDILSRPDFISSRFRDRRNVFIRMSHRLGVGQVNWIIRNRKDLDTVDQEGGLSIFERFIPDME